MLRKPLGRGLDALIENTKPQAAGEAAAALTMVAVERIVAGPFQPRRNFDPDRLQELTRAIEAHGVVEPLIVRRAPAAAADGGACYELIAGERRLRAARAASLKAVPVIVRELDDRAAVEMSLVENLAREDLTPIEEAGAFARLSHQFALSHEQIAGRIGKSRPYVSNAVRLLELPGEVQEMLARGLLSAGQARPILALASAQEQIEAARRILAGGISARGAEQIAQAHRRINGRSGRPVLDANLNAIAESLQRALKRKVRIVRRRGKTPGRIELEYYDDNDLTALATTLAANARPDYRAA